MESFDFLITFAILGIGLAAGTFVAFLETGDPLYFLALIGTIIAVVYAVRRLNK